MQILFEESYFFLHILFCYSNDEADFAWSYTFLEVDFVLENWCGIAISYIFT